MLAHCRIAGGTGQARTLHAAYVQGLTLGDLEIRGTLDDAVDYEFVTGVVHALTVVGAGQEALDLMGGAVVLSDSRLLDCGGNGISVGSGARFVAARVLVAGSRVGLLVKSGSRARLEDVLFRDDVTAAVVRVAGEHWPGTSRLRTRRTRVVDCRTPLRVENGVLDSAPDLQPGLEAGALGGLRGVLGLADWDELEPALRRWRESSP